MPELPEVEVVRRGLADHVLGHEVLRVEVRHPRAVRRQPGGAEEFKGLLTGRTLCGARRRGKFLWLLTDEPAVLLVAHLGMSGQLRVSSPAAAPGAGGAAPGPGGAGREPGGAEPPVQVEHLRVRLDLGDCELRFIDQRTFGWLAVNRPVVDPLGAEVPELVARIAPDPTEPVFELRTAARSLRRHRVEIKRLLLDQSIVSGIGNIYADEALWRSGVHPRRRADRLGIAALESVLRAAGAVMAEALAAGGTTFDGLYVNVNGRSGYFSRGLAVYGRAGEGCPRCGQPIVRERFTNRYSHFCPTCQRAPRASD